MAAKVHDVSSSINQICREKGGVYKDYSCKTISWDDAQRGTVGGALSCWGANITDTRLWERNGRVLFTVRSDNWNEKLGKVSADQIALIVGNHVRPSSSKSRGKDLPPVSLETFLKKIGEFGGYAGLLATQNLLDDKLDKKISIRFQTTFLPVADEEKATLEFASEAYNYNTHSDEDPKNLLLLCTTQGTAVQQDGAGAKKLFHHAIDSEGRTHRYWLEAERSGHKVGGGQVETKEEREDAVSRGKAVAKLIGLEAMKSRFNVLMTIQIPLKQKQPEKYRMKLDGINAEFCNAEIQYNTAEYKCMEMDDEDCSLEDISTTETNIPKSIPSRAKPPKIGTSNAARVSRGCEVDIWPGLSVKHPVERHPNEHVTVTVLIYNTVAGGVPSVDDVIAAIDDMEALYASCKWTGRLADDRAGFVKKELTVGDLQGIANKVHHQPYEPDLEPKEANFIQEKHDEPLADDGATVKKEHVVNGVAGTSTKVSKQQQPSQAEPSNSSSKNQKRRGKCTLL